IRVKIGCTDMAAVIGGLAENAEHEPLQVEDPRIESKAEGTVREIRRDSVSRLIPGDTRLASKTIEAKTFEVALAGKAGAESGAIAADEHAAFDERRFHWIRCRIGSDRCVTSLSRTNSEHPAGHEHKENDCTFHDSTSVMRLPTGLA